MESKTTCEHNKSYYGLLHRNDVDTILSILKGVVRVGYDVREDPYWKHNLLENELYSVSLNRTDSKWWIDIQ